MADLSQQAADSASETKQGTTEMVATVADVVTPSAPVVVPPISLPPANDTPVAEAAPAPTAAAANGAANGATVPAGPASSA
jgi:hypothetical protein